MASWREIMAGPGNVEAEEAQRAPGWHADPGGTGGQRYWDGEQWGELAEPDQVTQTDRAPAAPKGKANRLAVTALICATCVPFLLVAGALGVTFGYLALEEIEESEGKERGSAMAQWAIGLGFLNVAVSVAIIGMIVWLLIR
jgi:hypothetical protein